MACLWSFLFQVREETCMFPFKDTGVVATRYFIVTRHLSIKIWKIAVPQFAQPAFVLTEDLRTHMWNFITKVGTFNKHKGLHH